MWIIQDQPISAMAVRRALREVLACFYLLGGLGAPLAAADMRIDPKEIITLLPKDAIPAIRDTSPLLVPAGEARGVRDGDQVLGVTIDGESRAYPIPFLSWHEVVNDAIAGLPIAVTW
jgi:hypothetical protein